MGILDVLLWVAAGFWGLFFVQLVVNRLWLGDLSCMLVGQRGDWPLVSVVVPARNEERGIGAAVASFCKQDYPNIEVIVVEDCSTDGTGRVLEGLAGRFPNLRVVPGCDPAKGWLGKPNALEVGRKEAKGEWLLFVDADVVYDRQLVRRAVGYCLKRDVAMLTVCPQLRTAGVAEATLMSTLYLVGFGYMPSFLTNVQRFKGIAAGAGVMNLVRRDALEACGAFECLKDAIVDDVGLGYRVKAAGFDLHLALAGPLVRLRMYDGARATVAGLAKNTYPAIRQKAWLLPVLLVSGAWLSWLPYVGLFWGLGQGYVSRPAVVGLGLMHGVMGGICWWLRQPWYVAFLNPLRELGWWWILWRSWRAYRRLGLVWRGRRYVGN